MRVLIATPNAEIANAARFALRSESLTVDVMSGADDVLVRATEFPYDALILDLALPGGGVDLLKRLRSNRVTSPILVLTNDPSPNARIEAFHFGADDCLASPVFMPELVARVHALARRAARKAGDCLEIEDLVLHCDKRRAFRAGKGLPLTEREFLALEVLVRAHGQPVPASELLAKLWHDKETPKDNFIAVLIMRLRKKVDGNHAVKLLHTPRGRGYVVRVQQ